MLRRLRESVPDADVLVVDDESPDGTARLVDAVAGDDPHVRLVVRRGERGLGGAIRRAIEEAVEGDYTFFVNLDGDTSHAPEEVPRLMEAASRGEPSGDGSPPAKPDVVIGSRYVAGGQIVGWPLRRRMMSRILNRFATGCLRLPVRDCSGSMRCYRVDALRRVDRTTLRSNGYALLEELLVRLHRQGAAMVEVPITFTDRAAGESKLTFREAMRSVWQIVRLSWS